MPRLNHPSPVLPASEVAVRLTVDNGGRQVSADETSSGSKNEIMSSKSCRDNAVVCHHFPIPGGPSEAVAVEDDGTMSR